MRPQASTDPIKDAAIEPTPQQKPVTWLDIDLSSVCVPKPMETVVKS
jgi:hypothetical protein